MGGMGGGDGFVETAGIGVLECGQPILRPPCAGYAQLAAFGH